MPNFFHSIVDRCHNKNWINQVSYKGVNHTDKKEISKAFIDLFHSQFGSTLPSHFMFDWRTLLSFKLVVDLSSLDAPFSKSKIKAATFDLAVDKAPGPDGFPLAFFFINIGRL